MEAQAQIDLGGAMPVQEALLRDAVDLLQHLVVSQFAIAGSLALIAVVLFIRKR